VSEPAQIFPELLGWRLREIRAAKGILQREVARRMNVWPNVISKLENQPRRLGMNVFLRYCSAIDVPPQLALDFNIAPRTVAELTIAAGEPHGELLGAIWEELQGLTALHRAIILSAALSLTKNQMPIVDWIDV